MNKTERQTALALFEEFVESEWFAYKGNLSEHSRPDSGKRTRAAAPLFAEQDYEAFDLDAIFPALLYGKKNPPCSADSFMIRDGRIIVIEFKTGFKRKIGPWAANSLWCCKCQHASLIEDSSSFSITCPACGKLACSFEDMNQRLSDAFTDKRERIIKELNHSICQKLIETAVAFEKEIFPRAVAYYQEINRNLTLEQLCQLPIHFIAVTDRSEELMDLEASSLRRYWKKLGKRNYYFDVAYTTGVKGLSRYLAGGFNHLFQSPSP